MDITLHYEPTKKQLAFHETDVDEVLYGGAAGGGKSYAICWDALVRCLRYPKTHAYLFRRTYPELEQTLIQTMLSIVPRALGKYTASTHRMRLVNGSVLHFCHLSNEGKDMLTYQGAEIQWLYFDELTHFTKPMYDFIRSRVRAPDRMNIVPCVRCASNPGGPGHSWVKSYFVDATNIGETIITREVLLDGEDKPQKRTIQYIPATVRDNPHLPKSYEVELMLKPPKLRDALLYGKWDAFDGQAFPEFIDDREHYEDRQWTHVIAPFSIPLWWPRVVSFDHGYTRPYSFGAWAIDEEGRVYRYKELYGCKEGEPNTGVCQTPEEIARALEAFMEPEYREGIHVSGIADPAIWDRSRGTSVEEQIRRVFPGVTFIKGDNTRLAGKMQIHNRLRFDEDGRPMMYIFENCRDFRRTIPTLCYDAHKVEDIDTAGEDHIYDETRYFLMSRPIAAQQPVQPPKKVWNPLG